MVAARQRDSRSSLASNVSFGQLSASLARSRSQMPFASRSAAQSPVDNDDEDFDFDVGETDEDSVPRRAARIRSLHLGLVRHELPKEQKSVKFRGDRIQVCDDEGGGDSGVCDDEMVIQVCDVEREGDSGICDDECGRMPTFTAAETELNVDRRVLHRLRGEIKFLSKNAPC